MRGTDAAAPPLVAPEDLRAYRTALGDYPTGVTIVATLRPGGEPVGLTVNSFSSVSLAPPLVLWSLSRGSPSLAVFESCDGYAINILAADQRALSERFASPIAGKFAGVEWSPGSDGVPLVDGASVHIVCANHQRLDGGDHVIFLGRVEAYRRFDRAPLMYCRGRYVMPPAELDPSDTGV